MILTGAIQLCCVILTTFKNDMKDKSQKNQAKCLEDTFYILQILTQIMKPYYNKQCKLIKDETLLLIDVLCVNEKQLTKKLIELKIDVIDISVFVVSWIKCLFVTYFHLGFVQRVIDLVLLEEGSVLICLVYGIIVFMRNEILECQTDNDVFNILGGKLVSNQLKKDEFIKRVVRNANILFSRENNTFIKQGIYIYCNIFKHDNIYIY